MSTNEDPTPTDDPNETAHPTPEFIRRTFLRMALTATAGATAGLTAAQLTTATPAAAAERPTHPAPTPATTDDDYIVNRAGHGTFPLVANGHATPLLVSPEDHPGVTRVVTDLKNDITAVTGHTPATPQHPTTQDVVLIGTIGHSPLIDALIATKKLDVSDIEGRWETSLTQIVDNPMPGVRRALVITGSDQRGTIYGVYDVSLRIGVSPWYWWNDVPPLHQEELHVLPGRHSQGTPVVKYRGFFINDENPNLGGWGPKFFGPGLAPGFPGGFNSKLYARVFEVLLRLKANYLWPAVWGRAFAEDDPANHATATAYGVIMGTSHEAPMLRGIEEWNRHAVAAVRDSAGNIVTPGHDPYGGTGEWSFRFNSDALTKYWTDGIRRMVDQDIEGVVTIGMRGNGDVALPDGDGIELMQQIIARERQVLADVTGRDPSEVPQVWTMYKEVQRYWDEGLRPPDDVIVVFTDDNWGNIRRLPDPALPPRAGGYGLYYHFDYVGGGRDYKWVDSSLIANTWEQLHQAVTFGDFRLWMANVGDMKGNELPLQFFLDYAWNPARWPAERLGEWEQRYAAQNFGPRQAEAVAGILHTYAVLQSRRKPELLNRKITVDPTKNLSTDSNAVVYDDQATPFSLTDYRELDTVTEQWQQLADRAQRVGRTLPSAYQDAYYELVLYAVQATANLYALRSAEFTNLLHAGQGRAAANDLAAVAEARFADDAALAARYNNDIAGGKWQLFQIQPHIDYGDVARYGPNAPWQEPELNNWAIPDVIFPAVRRIDLPAGPLLGVAIDGSSAAWPSEPTPAVLPVFSPYQSQPAQFIDVFTRGTEGFTYHIRPSVPWITVTPSRGRVDKQVRATVRVDWRSAPTGRRQVPITITGPNDSTVVVTAVIDNPAVPRSRVRGFVEANGYVSMAADRAANVVHANGTAWQRIPDLGRTGSGMTVFPATAASVTPGGNSPRLEYRMYLFTTGQVTVWAYLSPRNDVRTTNGLRYAVSVDDEQPQTVNITTATGTSDATMNRQWERNTSDNVNLTATRHTITTPGTHVLKFWMVDPTVVVQKLVVDTGGLKPSYLGPPESLLR